MGLQLKAVDRLFERLAATYGAAWDRSLGTAPIGDVKSAWAHELAGFEDKLGMLAWALENLPERCPNVIEFRTLARRAPAPEAPRLPEPKADPARVSAEMAKLAPVLAEARAKFAAPVDHKAWAKRIVARHDEGDRINPTSLRFAREALGLSLATE